MQKERLIETAHSFRLSVNTPSPRSFSDLPIFVDIVSVFFAVFNTGGATHRKTFLVLVDNRRVKKDNDFEHFLSLPYLLKSAKSKRLRAFSCRSTIPPIPYYNSYLARYSQQYLCVTKNAGKRAKFKRAKTTHTHFLRCGRFRKKHRIDFQRT